MSAQGYDLWVDFSDAGPKYGEQALKGRAVRVIRSYEASSATAFARVGALSLEIVRVDAGFADPDAWNLDCDEFVEPLVATHAREIGLDGRVRGREPWSPTDGVGPDGSKLSPATPPNVRTDFKDVLAAVGLDAAKLLPGLERVRLAVIDRDFSKLSKYFPGQPEPKLIWFEKVLGSDPLSQGGHGVAMAAVAKVCTNAEVTLYKLGPEPSERYPYVGATLLAGAIATACADGADVILIASNASVWGAPRHLRRVIREAALRGRRNKGALIVHSAGDKTQTVVNQPSFALPADDLVSQPWVLAVGACNLDGSWGRRVDAPLSRLGPAIELVAPGDPTDVPVSNDLIMVDDTSASSAYVAAAAVLALAQNQELSGEQLRELLCMTAFKPEVVESDTSETLSAAAGCNEWDRSGHNFKLGYGLLDAHRTALAAADPVCAALVLVGMPTAPGVQGDVALRMATTWQSQISTSKHPLIREYKRLAPKLVRVFLENRAVRRTLLWCARHLIALTDGQARSWSQQSHASLLQRVVSSLWECVEHLGDVAVRSYVVTSEREILADNGRAVSEFLERLVFPPGA